MNDRRHPHPLIPAAVGAAVAVAATLAVQQAQQPPQNASWSGTRAQPAKWSRAGDYRGAGWAVVLPQAAGNTDTDAAAILGSGVKLHGLRGVHGRSCFRVHSNSGATLSDVLLDGCVAQDAGLPGSPHGSGGQGAYADLVQNFTVQNFTSTGSAGHAFYLGRTAQKVRFSRLNLTANRPHADGILQLNSGGGGGTPPGQGFRDFECADSTFTETSGTVTVLNLLGAGFPNDPVRFVRDTFNGGGNPRAVLVSNFAAPRPSFARFQACVVNGGVVVEGNSVLTIDGATRISGPIKTLSGGRVVHQ
jgi:hypothetical protein